METVQVFNVKVIKTPEGFTGKCLELPGAISEGNTLDDLKTNMRGAIEIMLEAIPESSKNDQKIVIEIKIESPKQ